MMRKTGKFSNVVYTDEPLEFTIVEDNLPPPDQLVFTEEKTRVTINLNESCVRFFKGEAKRYRTPYQKLIRSVLDVYVRNATAKARQRAAAKAGVSTQADKTKGAPVTRAKARKPLKGAST
jgi:hypothetical protein